MADAVHAIRGFLSAETTQLVLTADSNGIVCAETDSKYLQAFQNAALITPDSSGVVWALERYRKPVPGKVSGVDLVPEIFRLSVETGCSIALIGGAPGVAQAASDRLCEQFPGANVVFIRDGYFSVDEETEVAKQVAKCHPDILLVAMGMPRQENFILSTKAIIQAKVGIGIGGSLDVHSGRVKRAPKIIQRAKLEWLWRLALNPSKLVKVKNLPLFRRKVIAATKNLP
jgi:N-acetylglucosaminyldiphosphoundecaprenol N-acetyl-beta-D-mannosaminyltransferase